MTQLVLPVRLADFARFDNFFVASANAASVFALQQCARCQSEQWIFLAGNAGSGRSHLLQATCQSAAESPLAADARYLPLGLLIEADAAEVLAGIEAARLVCFDDVDAIAGNDRWQEQLFHALNRLRENHVSVVFAARQPPAGLDVRLADLTSRLAWSTVYRLGDLDDAQKSQLLQFRARCRAMSLPPEVADFIVQRGERDLASLINTLDVIDQQTLAQSRRVTIPFVKSVLGW